MVKCGPCQRNECKREYRNRNVCANPKECTCTCQESTAATFFKGFFSIVGGAAVIAGGVAATILTGGVAGVVIAGVAIGGGSSLVTNPVFKKISGERVSAGDLAIDVGIGSAVGMVTGGFGAGGSALAKSATGAAKVGITAATRAGAGVVGGAISETSNAIQKGEASVGSFAKAMGVGAVSGLAGGVSSKAAGSVTKVMSNGVAKAVTRVAVQAGTGAVCATACEAIEAGGPHKMKADNWKRVAATAATQAAVAGTYECTRNTVIKTEAYADKMGKSELKRLSKEVVEAETKKAEEYDRKSAEYRDRLEPLSKSSKTNKQAIENLKKDKDDAFKGTSLTPEDKKKINQGFNELKEKLETKQTEINQEIQDVQKQLGDAKPVRIGDKKKVHFLTGNLAPNAAFDLPHEGEGPGRRRAMFSQSGGDFSYEGHTNVHDYDDLRKYGKYSCQPGSEAVNVERMRAAEKMEEEKEKKED